jgi:hypothetical protein
MKERLVRGTNVASVVRVLRAHARNRPLPELGAREQELLRKRVAPSTWYSLNLFDALLQLVHRYVYDGSELAAQNMGRSQARARLEGSLRTAILAADPIESLRRFASAWRDQYNFGEVAVTPLASDDGQRGARVVLSGYPDMSACHGLTIVGFALETVEQSGGTAAHAQIQERPWMHNNVLTFVLRWS